MAALRLRREHATLIRPATAPKRSHLGHVVDAELAWRA
jgi:hypothetical protein